MTPDERINALAAWGTEIDRLHRAGALDELIVSAQGKNPLFNVPDIKFSLNAVVANYLDREKLGIWMDAYNVDQEPLRKVGLVLAGNIPLVGFQDVLATLASGNTALIKPSSKDEVLIKALVEILKGISPELGGRIRFTEEHLNGFDAIIATGSNNTSRYFEYYFQRYKHIIRHNRNSVAVLTGDESEEELTELGRDIFTYLGLGCRNVSKLYLPQGYDFKALFAHLECYSEVLTNPKYSNNYDYNKSIYLVNKEPHLDNGFVLMKESEQIGSPMAVLHYQTYDDIAEAKAHVMTHREAIQCLVTKADIHPNRIAFGKAQQPQLRDYPDNVDTMKFLTEWD